MDQLPPCPRSTPLACLPTSHLQPKLIFQSKEPVNCFLLPLTALPWCRSDCLQYHPALLIQGWLFPASDHQISRQGRRYGFLSQALPMTGS